MKTYSTLELLPVRDQEVFLNFDSSDYRLFSAIFMVEDNRPFFRVRVSKLIVEDDYVDTFPMGTRACYFKFPRNEETRVYIRNEVEEELSRVE